MGKVEQWRARAKSLKQDVGATYLALLDRRTPWHAKVVAICVVAYAASPIDLIPDAIPIVGYLDDLILVPLGIGLVRRLIPPHIMAECRGKAAQGGRRSRVLPWLGAVVIGCAWLATLAAMTYAVWRWRRPR
jgi:uncharacterized membrane protein YkvA (DUF1232 family)